MNQINIQRWLADAAQSLVTANLSYSKGDVSDTVERLEALIDDLPDLLTAIAAHLDD